MSKRRLEPEGLLPLTPAVFHLLLALADGKSGRGKRLLVAYREAL